MKSIDLVNARWMITPEYLSHIVALPEHIYSKGDEIQAVHSAEHDDEEDRHRRGFQIVGNTAIVPIFGPVTPEDDFFSFLFGGVSFDKIKQDISFAISEGLKTILHIRSPGGTVEGAFETADFIKELAEDNDIITFSDGMIASAAVLLSSATNKTFISGKTNQVGSIGVIARRMDRTKQNEDFGESIESFVSGKFKNISDPDKKITDFDRAAIQEQVDSLASLFARDFSENRGIPIETVASWEAKIFIGQQALDNGLVDGVSTLETLVEQNNSNLISLFRGVNMSKKLSMEELQVENPELVNQIREAAGTVAETEGNAQGVQDERARMIGIQENSFPGQEELVKKLIADGTDVPEAMSQLIKDHKASGAKAQQDPLPDAVHALENQTPGPDEPEKKKDFMTQVDEYQIKHAVTRTTALKFIVSMNPKGHRAWVEGQVIN